MKKLKLISVLLIILIGASGCRVETYPDDYVLEVYFSPSQHEHWGWAASTSMMFNYYGVYYSQSDLVDYQYYYFDYSNPSIHDISWLLWDLGEIDSYITGRLTFREIRSHLDRGDPLLLHYGGFYNGHYILIYGYDHHGHVYFHESGYGTRIVHYEDLEYRSFHGNWHSWESSLVMW